MNLYDELGHKDNNPQSQGNLHYLDGLVRSGRPTTNTC